MGLYHDEEKRPALYYYAPREGQDPYPLQLEVDLTSEGAVQAAIEQTVVHFGRLDAIVNNASYGQLGALEELTQPQIQNAFTVNVFANLNVIRQAFPHLRQQREVHIFNISSFSGWLGHSGSSIYNGTKFAVGGYHGCAGAGA